MTSFCVCTGRGRLEVRRWTRRTNRLALLVEHSTARQSPVTHLTHQRTNKCTEPSGLLNSSGGTRTDPGYTDHGGQHGNHGLRRENDSRCDVTLERFKTQLIHARIGDQPTSYPTTNRSFDVECSQSMCRSLASTKQTVRAKPENHSLSHYRVATVAFIDCNESNVKL